MIFYRRSTKHGGCCAQSNKSCCGQQGPSTFERGRTDQSGRETDQQCHSSFNSGSRIRHAAAAPGIYFPALVLKNSRVESETGGRVLLESRHGLAGVYDGRRRKRGGWRGRKRRLHAHTSCSRAEKESASRGGANRRRRLQSECRRIGECAGVESVAANHAEPVCGDSWNASGPDGGL